MYVDDGKVCLLARLSATHETTCFPAVSFIWLVSPVSATRASNSRSFSGSRSGWKAAKQHLLSLMGNHSLSVRSPYRRRRPSLDIETSNARACGRAYTISWTNTHRVLSLLCYHHSHLLVEHRLGDLRKCLILLGCCFYCLCHDLHGHDRCCRRDHYHHGHCSRCHPHKACGQETDSFWISPIEGKQIAPSQLAQTREKRVDYCACAYSSRCSSQTVVTCFTVRNNPQQIALSQLAQGRRGWSESAHIEGVEPH